VGKNFEWPLSEQAIASFIQFAIKEKNLKHATVKSYISSFALYQNLRNMDPKNCFSFQTKTLLKGAKNLEFYKENRKPSRKAMTYPLLKVLCHQVATTDWPKFNKQVFWTALTVAFFGAFRFGELLSSQRYSFNKFETLMWEDIKFTNSSAILTIKVPKSKNLKGEFVDIFEIPDERFCPVKALKALKQSVKNFSEKTPVFTFENGQFLTSEVVNTTLHALLTPILGDDAGQYSGHSFRAGLPSALASCPDLAADEQIKTVGRWSSDAFRLYTRLKYQQKRQLFEKILVALNRQ
jgi:hypothetical protein